MANKLKYKSDLSGDRFGRLLVISEVPKEERKNKKYREFVCRCDCGSIVRTRRNNLLSGNSLSCGCLEKDFAHYRAVESLFGKRFGRLVVIDEADDSKPAHLRLLCQCDCGQIKSISKIDLVSNRTKSCGCLRREESRKRNTEDLTGQTFNELTAIRQVEDFVGAGNYRRTQWLFKCSCGVEIKALAVNVKHGYTKSCGHLGNSIAEYQIKQWLTNRCIQFDTQATFDDCINPRTGYKLYFDFKIYRNDGSFFMIEHQGEQHFVGRDICFGKQQREQTDTIKKDYCNTHNITLYETLYNEDYIEKLQFIVNKEIENYADADKKEVICG